MNISKFQGFLQIILKVETLECSQGFIDQSYHSLDESIYLLSLTL